MDYVLHHFSQGEVYGNEIVWQRKLYKCWHDIEQLCAKIRFKANTIPTAQTYTYRHKNWFYILNMHKAVDAHQVILTESYFLLIYSCNNYNTCTHKILFLFYIHWVDVDVYCMWTFTVLLLPQTARNCCRYVYMEPNT